MNTHIELKNQLNYIFMFKFKLYFFHFKAVNKLHEIMNRKEFSGKQGKKVSASELRKKEKECRRLQQDLTQVSILSAQRKYCVFKS